MNDIYFSSSSRVNPIRAPLDAREPPQPSLVSRVVSCCLCCLSDPPEVVERRASLLPLRPSQLESIEGASSFLSLEQEPLSVGPCEEAVSLQEIVLLEQSVEQKAPDLPAQAVAMQEEAEEEGTGWAWSETLFSALVAFSSRGEE